MKFIVKRSVLQGTTQIPGNKSASARAIVLGGLSEGVSRVSNPLPGVDSFSIVGMMRALGAKIDTSNPQEWGFEGVANVNPADKATILANGISEAMNCTMFGLLVAIPMLVLFSVLGGRTNALIADMNETSVAVLNLIVQNKDKFKNMTVPAQSEE